MVPNNAATTTSASDSATWKGTKKLRSPAPPADVRGFELRSAISTLVWLAVHAGAIPNSTAQNTAQATVTQRTVGLGCIEIACSASTFPSM